MRLLRTLRKKDHTNFGVPVWTDLIAALGMFFELDLIDVNVSVTMNLPSCLTIDVSNFFHYVLLIRFSAMKASTFEGTENVKKNRQNIIICYGYNRRYDVSSYKLLK